MSYIMEVNKLEWLRRENYFLREQNKKLRDELIVTKKYLDDVLKKLKIYKNHN